MKHPFALSLGALALTVTALGAASSASAHGWQNGQGNQLKPTFAQHRVAANQALEDGDYSAWVESLGDHPFAQQLTDTITEDTFETFVQAHQLMQDGDREAAQTLFAELGLPEHPLSLHSRNRGQHMRLAMNDVREALGAADYTAFEQAVPARHPFAQLTEDQFATLAEAHQLRQAGDHEGARALMTELNLPIPQLRGQR